MKISELSRRSETSVSTIKYYIRAGLLAHGEQTARNQASYGDKHLERLDLIWRLKEYAGLSIETIGTVLNAAGAAPDEYRSMGAGLNAAGQDSRMSQRDGPTRGQEMISNFIQSKGWELTTDDNTVRDIALALDRVLEGWPFELPDNVLEVYANQALEVAQLEIPDDWHDGLDENEALKFALLGTFLFEPLILSIRRLAHRVRIIQSMN